MQFDLVLGIIIRNGIDVSMCESKRWSESMASIILSPKDIFEQEFKSSMRGYDKSEVDEFLDDVIKDYETFAAQLQELRKENEALKQELKNRMASAQQSKQPSDAVRVSQSATNFDILKRISRLEREVFGKRITE